MIDEPEVWTSGGLAADFADTHRMMENRSFAFILGAGASVSSGIPSGGTLVQRWIQELHTLLCADGRSVEQWATPESLDIDEFDISRAVEFYPQVFLRRFRSDREQGYAYLEHVMEGAEPSYGYSVLAQILSETRHRVVITTNFDNLVADAISIYGSTYPLVAGHESLTGFISGRLRRPLVAKIHRDLFLEPKNDPEGVASLPEAWRDALRRLLREHTPIFLGYGGNDGSLMGFLESLESRDVSGRLRWCYREADGPPFDRVRQVVARLEGVLVPIQGFDEQMLQFGNALKFGIRDQYVRDRGIQRAETLRLQFERLAGYVSAAAVEPKPSEASEDTRRAIDEMLTRADSAGAYLVRIGRERNSDKRVALAREAVARYPGEGALLAALAMELADRAVDEAAMEEAKDVARQALRVGQLTPGVRGMLYGEILGDVLAADEQYQAAFDLDPDNGNAMCNRAELWLDQGNTNLARTYLAETRRTLARSPERQAPHLSLGVEVLETIANLIDGASSTDSLVRIRQILEQGVRAENYSVTGLQKALPLRLSGGPLEFALALLEVFVGRAGIDELDAFSAWTDLPSAEGRPQ